MTYTHTVVEEVQTGVDGRWHILTLWSWRYRREWTGDGIYSHCGRGGTDGSRQEMTYTHTVVVEVQTGVDGR